MDEGNILRIGKGAWKIPLRIVSLLAFFLGACSLVQCVLMLMKYYEQQNLSMLVVFIFLLVTPLTFAASLFFAFGVHRICADTGSDRLIVLGFAMMILASVDNLIYISIHRSSDSVSFYLLGGIQVICFVICFLYYQDIGTFSLTFCASILLAACALLELEEAIRYIACIELVELTDLYYLVKNVLNTLIAVLALLLLFGLEKGIRTKD
jgi:hypothetical protein